jgi:outer membrane lipoprotein-sorting protein
VNKGGYVKKIIPALFIASMTLPFGLLKAKSADDMLDAFKSAWKQVSTYQVTMTVHQEKDGKSEDRKIKLYYKKPGWIRTDILEGKNQGGIAVYNPETDKVKAKLGITPVVTLSPDAKMACSIRGETLPEGSFAAMVKQVDWYKANGSITYTGQANVDGVLCDVIELKTGATDKNKGIAAEKWWMDPQTGFPRKINDFDSAGNKVSWVVFRGLTINPQLECDLFDL